MKTHKDLDVWKEAMTLARQISQKKKNAARSDKAPKRQKWEIGNEYKNEDSKGFGLDAWKSMDLVDSIYKIKLH